MNNSVQIHHITKSESTTKHHTLLFLIPLLLFTIAIFLFLINFDINPQKSAQTVNGVDQLVKQNEQSEVLGETNSLDK
jgi:hypothetical protein